MVPGLRVSMEVSTSPISSGLRDERSGNNRKLTGKWKVVYVTGAADCDPVSVAETDGDSVEGGAGADVPTSSCTPAGGWVAEAI